MAYKLIDKDKALHFGSCLVLSLIHPMLAVGAAIGKEYGDSKASGNHWCWYDLIADGIGTAIGSVVWWLIWHCGKLG